MAYLYKILAQYHIYKRGELGRTSPCQGELFHPALQKSLAAMVNILILSSRLHQIPPLPPELVDSVEYVNQLPGARLNLDKHHDDDDDADDDDDDEHYDDADNDDKDSVRYINKLHATCRNLGQ